MPFRGVSSEDLARFFERKADEAFARNDFERESEYREFAHRAWCGTLCRECRLSEADDDA